MIVGFRFGYFKIDSADVIVLLSSKSSRAAGQSVLRANVVIIILSLFYEMYNYTTRGWQMILVRVYDL